MVATEPRTEEQDTIAIGNYYYIIDHNAIEPPRSKLIEDPLKVFGRRWGSSCHEDNINLKHVPAILRSCKSIHGEASPLLYSKNRFELNISAKSTNQSPITPSHVEGWEETEQQCKKLFSFTISTLPASLRSNGSAQFLHIVGAQNASNLSTLKLYIDRDGPYYSHDHSHVAATIRTILLLLALYVPNLKHLALIYDIDDIKAYPDANGLVPYRLDDRVTKTVEEDCFDVLQEYKGMLSRLDFLLLVGLKRDPFLAEELRKLEKGIDRDKEGDIDEDGLWF